MRIKYVSSAVCKSSGLICITYCLTCWSCVWSLFRRISGDCSQDLNICIFDQNQLRTGEARAEQVNRWTGDKGLRPKIKYLQLHVCLWRCDLRQHPDGGSGFQSSSLASSWWTLCCLLFQRESLRTMNTWTHQYVLRTKPPQVHAEHHPLHVLVMYLRPLSVGAAPWPPPLLWCLCQTGGSSSPLRLSPCSPCVGSSCCSSWAFVSTVSTFWVERVHAGFLSASSKTNQSWGVFNL